MTHTQLLEHLGFRQELHYSSSTQSTKTVWTLEQDSQIVLTEDDLKHLSEDELKQVVRASIDSLIIELGKKLRAISDRIN